MSNDNSKPVEWWHKACLTHYGDEPAPHKVSESKSKLYSGREQDETLAAGRVPGTNRDGEYDTAQMLLDDLYGGDTSQELYD